MPSKKDDALETQETKSSHHGNVIGLTEAAIKRHVKRGGGMCLHGLTYRMPGPMGALFLRQVLRRIALLSIRSGKRTVRVHDVCAALEASGVNLVGFSDADAATTGTVASKKSEPAQ